MKICCLGSLNIDMVFNMEKFVKPKETIHSNNLNLFAGGKGLNQAIAIKKTDSDVFMAGTIGKDGDILLKECDKHNLDRNYVRKIEGNSGLAVIQVNKRGENCIILYDGANKKNDKCFIDEVINSLSENDFIVLQNEINDLEYILKKSKERNLTVFLNPSPIEDNIMRLSLELCDYIILNEVEGESLSGKSDYKEVVSFLSNKYNNNIILTVGEKGVYFNKDKAIIHKESMKVEVVDTTGAGDTFTGYFIGMLSRGLELEKAIEIGIKAAGISVTREGASESIPSVEEVL